MRVECEDIGLRRGDRDLERIWDRLVKTGDLEHILQFIVITCVINGYELFVTCMV